MKKIKTLNKLLNSLTLLSPLAGIGFNNQYENQQTVVTENNNALNNYFTTNAEPVKMGDIYVNLDDTGKIIQSYASGEGALIVSDYITEIGANAFNSDTYPDRGKVYSLDLSNATSLTTIGENAFRTCSKLSGDLEIPSSVTTINLSAFEGPEFTSIDFSRAWNLKTIGQRAFNRSLSVTSLDLSQATNLTTIGIGAFTECNIESENLVIPSSVTNIESQAFFAHYRSISFVNLYFLSETPPTSFGADWQPTVTGKVYVPSEEAKQAYLKAENFGFDSSVVDVIGVSGNTAINIKQNSSGSEQYLPIESFSATKWEIVMTEGEQPEWLSIDNQGLLSWTDQSVAGIYKFKIKATNDFQESLESSPINFNAYDSKIVGDEQINVKPSNPGSKQYTLVSTPEGLSPDQWEIVMTEEGAVQPEWLSIDNQGLLSWTNQCVKGTYKFKIRTTNNHSGLQIEKDVTLDIKSANIALILGLLFGLGIPIILALGFGIYYLTKKKETTVKIKKKK